jgi:hypothetical protein
MGKAFTSWGSTYCAMESSAAATAAASGGLKQRFLLRAVSLSLAQHSGMGLSVRGLDMRYGCCWLGCGTFSECLSSSLSEAAWAKQQEQGRAGPFALW